MSDASNNVDKARKSDEPWSDEERTAFINHVLARADMSSILNELPEALGKEGFPIRARSAYQKQWVRKIQKDVLATYSAKAPTSPTKAGSSKTGGSPKKRFRQEEKGE